jgi:hypothetical protein
MERGFRKKGFNFLGAESEKSGSALPPSVSTQSKIRQIIAVW